MVGDIEHLFIHLLAIYVFFAKMLIQVFFQLIETESRIDTAKGLGVGKTVTYWSKITSSDMQGE